MDNNWIVEEIQTEIEIELNSMKTLQKTARNFIAQYKDVFNTDDKFEVKNHEYWRTVELMTEKNINFFGKVLKDINDMKKEDISYLQEMENETRANSLVLGHI